MNYHEIQNIIQKDKGRNVHPKNRMFILLFRYGQYFYVNAKKNVLFLILSLLVRVGIKIFINRNNHYPLEASIGGGLRLPHNFGIVISGDTVIGENATIMHQVTIGADVTGSDKSPVIGNQVFIGAGAKVIGQCKVGSNVIVGANAVVTKNVPDNYTVVGFNRLISPKCNNIYNLPGRKS